MAADSTEGGNVLSAAGTTTDHDVATDTAELMDEDIGGKDGEIVNDDFASELGTIAEDATVTDDIVVSNVHAFHKEIVGADYGAAFGSGASVDGDVFTDGIVITDFSGSLFATELEVLGNGTDNGTREDAVTITDTAAREDGDAVHEGIVVADDYIGIDVAERTDLAVFTDFGFGMNVC